MRDELTAAKEASPAIARRMPRDLTIIMQLDKATGQWRLALSKKDMIPSWNEIGLCKDAFNVPAGTETTYRRVVRTHPTTKRKYTNYIAEMRWIEAEQEAQPA